MEIRTILVNIDIDTKSPELVQCAVDLATRFNASLIGLAAGQLSPMLYAADGGVAAGTWYVEERELLEKGIQAAQEHFRSLVPAGIKSSWRGYIDRPNHALVNSARCADLILLSSTPSPKPDYSDPVDVGELVLSAGRPVLVAGSGVSAIKGEKIVVAWKDTREARRAVSDALPLLKAADEVLAVTVDEGDYGPERAGLDDLVAWLVAHQVKVRGDVLALDGSAAATIEKAAVSLGADLVVSGGYGHSRLREWLLGGVTRELLAGATLNRFLSN